MTLARVPIRTLCQKVTSGGTPSRAISEYWQDGTIKWIKTGELKDGPVLDAEESITESGLINSSAKVFPEETVLMAMYGDGKTITSLGILKTPAATNQACCAMIVDPEKCHPSFLFHSLKLVRHELLGLVVAGAQRNLSLGIVSAFEVPYLPLPRQRAVVELLNVYDDLIRNNRRRITILETLARNLYQEWFVRLRFPGHKAIKIVDGVPDGWSRTTLGEVLTLQRGFDLPAQDRNPGPVPIYASTGVTGYHSVSKVKGPGIVTGRSGSLGTVMYVKGDFWPLNTTLWVKEIQVGVSLAFATFLLRSVGLAKFNGGVAVPTLNRNDVHRIAVIIPSPEIMDAFSAFSETIFESTQTIQNEIDSLSRARDFLLPRLMSGELEP